MIGDIDIVVGVVGSFLGGTVFRGLHIRPPLGGLPGTIFVAFVRAIVPLVAIRLIRSVTTRASGTK